MNYLFTMHSAIVCTLIITGVPDRERLPPTEVEDEIGRFQGTWEIHRITNKGERTRVPRTEKGNPPQLLFQGKELYVIHDGKKSPWLFARFHVDVSASPKSIDIQYESLALPEQGAEGIYEITGDTLRWCFHPIGEKPSRPCQFSSTLENQQSIEIWKRVNTTQHRVRKSATKRETEHESQVGQH